MVAVGAGCVPGEPGKSALHVIVIALVRKVAKPNQMGGRRKWKEGGESNEECLVYLYCANLLYKQDVCVVWGFLSFI